MSNEGDRPTSGLKISKAEVLLHHYLNEGAEKGRKRGEHHGLNLKIQQPQLIID